MKSCTFLFVLFVFAGCASVTVMPKETVKSPTPSDAWIVLGMGLGDTSFHGFTANAVQQGNFNRTQGVIRSKFSARPARQQVNLMPYPEGDYVAVSDGKVAYRSWKVETGKKVLVYVTSLSGEQRSNWHIRYVKPDAVFSATCDMPVTFWNPGEEFYMSGGFQKPWKSDEARWQFTGCYLTVEKPGVYYLGDILLNGNILMKNENAKNNVTETAAKFSFSLASSPEQMKVFVNETGLGWLPLFEPAAVCQEIPGSEWNARAEGTK